MTAQQLKTEVAGREALQVWQDAVLPMWARCRRAAGKRYDVRLEADYSFAHAMMAALNGEEA
jgi:hypothetical protein